ncbi:MAG TPA: sugar phosphate nucleotidyltransferase, partial [Isosphaeraceae bacterium]
HLENRAQATIATIPVAEQDATACGIMKIDEAGRVASFEEKPKTPAALARVRTEPAWMERLGIRAEGRPYLASMGIYLFNRATLVELLGAGGATDFGRELFPQVIAGHRVQAYLFDGYWEDIGTVGAFHKANIDLTQDNPPFRFSTVDYTVFTRPRYLPCSRLSGATITHSLISDGCTIRAGTVIENSVIGVRAVIGEGVTIRNSYIMGADSFEMTHHGDERARAGRPALGIGAGTTIENAIVDKNARIGGNVRIANDAHVVDGEETPYGVIRDGIVVVPKFTVIPDGTTL